MTSHGLRSYREIRFFKIGPFDTLGSRVSTGSEPPSRTAKASKNDALPPPQSKRCLITALYACAFTRGNDWRLDLEGMREGFDRRGTRIETEFENLIWSW